MNGLLSLSIDHSLSLNSDAFSILKRESIPIVVCKSKEDNSLCPNKNCCFLLTTPSYQFEEIKSSNITKEGLGQVYFIQNSQFFQLILLSLFLFLPSKEKLISAAIFL